MDARTNKQLEHLRDMRVEEAMRPYQIIIHPKNGKSYTRIIRRKK